MPMQGAQVLTVGVRCSLVSGPIEGRRGLDNSVVSMLREQAQACENRKMNQVMPCSQIGMGSWKDSGLAGQANHGVGAGRKVQALVLVPGILLGLTQGLMAACTKI